MDDPFLEFGGRILNQAPEYNNHPFVEFGGRLIDPPDESKKPVTKVPVKQFLADYMSSPMYKQRLSNFNITDSPDIKNVLNTIIGEKKGAGSASLNKQLSNEITSKDAGFPIVKNKSNINIDRSQIPAINSMYGVDAKPDGLLAHELSHVSRKLSPQEEHLISKKDIIKPERDLYKEFTKQGLLYDSKTMQPLSFSEYISNFYQDSANVHDAQPREIKADLDALRYNMFKKGIYDTSKRNMTMDDYNKMSSDREIQKSLEFKRLKQRFKPEGILKLNNTIASNHLSGSTKNNI